MTSRMDEPDSGRVRRYVTVTKQGLAVVKATRDAHTRLWQGLTCFLRTHKA